MELIEKLSFVAARLGDRFISGVVLMRMQETVVRNEGLGPDAANVVLAARYERVRDGTAWHEAADLAPRQRGDCSRVIQVDESVVQVVWPAFKMWFQW